MAFDAKDFMNQKFENRTEDVPVPSLAHFFNEDEKPVWKVRNLTGPEIGACKVSAEKDKAIQATLNMLVSQDVSDKVKGMSELLDLGVKRERTGNTPERLHQLIMGSVSPKCTLDLAVKLSKVYPVVFLDLTNKILELSGKGMVRKDVEKKPESS